MPRLEETNEQLTQAGKRAKLNVSRFWDGFSDFIFQDNVLEVAVGLIIAAAFTTVVKSFVSDIITPILSLLPFIDRNFNEKFAVLRRGPGYRKYHGYNTVESAQDDGAVVMTYGYVVRTFAAFRLMGKWLTGLLYFERSKFVNEVFNLLGIGLALYFIAMTYGWAAKDNIIKHTVKCKYCRKRISEKASSH